MYLLNAAELDLLFPASAMEAFKSGAPHHCQSNHQFIYVRIHSSSIKAKSSGLLPLLILLVREA